VEREGEERGAIGQVGEEEWLLQSTLSQWPLPYTTYITYKYTYYYNSKVKG
jgi:hypothetical protein